MKEKWCKTRDQVNFYLNTMKFNKLITFFLVLPVCRAAIQDYFRGLTTYFGIAQVNPIEEGDVEGFAQRIPYEVSVVDEKFIAEAAKLTGVSLSELDKCQQRVVLRLKKGCQRLNDEDISKMAVMLLNCQSAIEGRRLYPCTEEMSIKECTTSMDADTWNTYHLMANRVRAVCYSSRQSQFIGITEHTINRLLDTAQNQIRTLDKLVHTQENLKSIAEDTLRNVEEGNKDIILQQEDMAKAQFHRQLIVEDNIRRLVDEKKLIRDSHSELSELTRNVQAKLEDAAKQLEDQTKTSNVNHKELLKDLVEIQKKTQDIFHRIEESSTLLVKQNEEAQKQYYSTLKQLSEVNNTVHSLVTLIYSTRQILEEKLSWLSDALGGTDIAVDRIYLLTWHLSFVILGMITCAFLSCNTLTRFLVTVLPVGNVIVGLYDITLALKPFELGSTLFLIVIGTYVTYGVVKLHKSRATLAATHSIPEITEKSANFEKDKYFESQLTTTNLNGLLSTKCNDKDVYVGKSYNYTTKESDSEKSVCEQEDNFAEFSSPTPPLSRSGYYSSRSRSRTPLHINTGLKGPCKATTRLGTPCKLFSVPGRDFCRRHQGGDSVM